MRQPPAPATSIFLDLCGLAPARADLRLLGEISAAYARLPWENLTKYLRKHGGEDAGSGAAASRRAALPARLRDVPGAERLRLSAEVLSDHAALGTGGTCFSLTNALRRIVADLGFTAWPAMADMKHGANIHCGLVVELDGRRWLLDPGYLVPEPVPLAPGRTVHVAHPGHRLAYRLDGTTGEVELRTLSDRGEEIPRYRLRPDPIPEAEFVRHWIESFDAAGMNGLHLGRVTGEARLYAHDLNLRIDDGRRKENVKLRDGYAAQVAARFGLDEALVRRVETIWREARCRG